MALLVCRRCGWEEEGEALLQVKWTMPSSAPIAICYPVQMQGEVKDRYYLPFCARCIVKVDDSERSWE